MHIQEGTNTTLTTCTKMTEEVDRRHGVNGNSGGKAATDDAPVHNSTLNATGGRLKFFKDGKFILELVRGCARDGERAGWVSVPRKTFWPPAGAPGTPPGAPALSVSDDNSSVQSSPWQRDHCWKQQAPRKNLGTELAMYYCRPNTLPTAAIAAESRARRRRPHLPPPRRARLGDEQRAVDELDAAVPRDDDRERYHRMKLKKPYQYRKLRTYRKTRPPLRPKELERTIRRLHERLPAPATAPVAAPAPLVNAKLAGCRHEHALVSPRKRILRELERVSLEDGGGKRRARPAPALSTASYPPSPGPSHARDPPPRRDPPARHISPYSIHSLLSMGDEAPPPEPRPAKSSSSPGAVVRSAASPAPSPSPDPYRHRAGARDSPPGWARAARGWAAAGVGARAREEWPYYAAYPAAAPYLYRPPAALWLQYVPPAPSPWAPLPLPLLTDHVSKEEPTSDLPLNLSKH